MNNPIVIAAFIGFLGTIIAALIPYIIVRKKRWSIKIIISFGLIGCFIGMIIGIKVAAYIIKPIDDCCSAKIISPKGTKNQLDAIAFPVQNKTKLFWVPDDCVMTVQYYQDNYLRKEYKNVISGSEININELTSGKTEIKIWRVGLKKPADYIWVWVNNIPEPTLAITSPVHNGGIELELQDETGSCSFSVSGISAGVSSNSDRQIYVLLHVASPPSPGWWIQYNTTFFPNGDWETVAWCGDKEFPQRPGDIIDILAFVINSAPGISLKKIDNPNDINPLALSDRIRVTVSSIIKYRSHVLLIKQVRSEIVVENISKSPIAIRISWDGNDPYGTGRGADSFINDNVIPRTYINKNFHGHNSVQIWAWGPWPSKALIDSCSLSIDN